MFKKFLYAALGVLVVSGAVAATNLSLSTGVHFLPGFRLVTGDDLNIMLDAENTLRNQTDGTTAGTYKGVYNGTVGATTPSTGAFTTISATNGLSPAGSFTIDPSASGNTCSHPSMLSTDGTDTTPAVTETFVAPVTISANETITGVRVMNGSVAAGNITVGLADSTGAPIAAAISASTAMSGTDAYQQIAFAAPYAAKGPATYYVQEQFNSVSARLNTILYAACNTVKQTAQVFGTMTSFTPPTTFTASVGPYADLY